MTRAPPRELDLEAARARSANIQADFRKTLDEHDAMMARLRKEDAEIAALKPPRKNAAKKERLTAKDRKAISADKAFAAALQKSMSAPAYRAPLVESDKDLWRRLQRLKRAGLVKLNPREGAPHQLVVLVVSEEDEPKRMNPATRADLAALRAQSANACKLADVKARTKKAFDAKAKKARGEREAARAKTAADIEAARLERLTVRGKARSKCEGARAAVREAKPGKKNAR